MNAGKSNQQGGMLFILFCNVLSFQTPGLDLRVDSGAGVLLLLQQRLFSATELACFWPVNCDFVCVSEQGVSWWLCVCDSVCVRFTHGL